MLKKIVYVCAIFSAMNNCSKSNKLLFRLPLSGLAMLAYFGCDLFVSALETRLPAEGECRDAI
tara:strand:+ start:1658 stop:1846 length:189 start_codon:yes stop_codon:yes gene_type:complete